MKELLIKSIHPIARAISACKPNHYTLMFHSICQDSCTDSLSLNVHLFKQLVIHLQNTGKIISTEQMMLNSKSSRRNTFTLTFDDGYTDNYALLFPILKELDIPATIFLATSGMDAGYLDFDFIKWTLKHSDGQGFAHAESGITIPPFDKGEYMAATRKVINSLKKVRHSARVSFISRMATHYSPPAMERCMMTWDNVKEMSRTGLVTFGAHTMTHPIMSNISEAEALEEIEGSRDAILANTGRKPLFFAYPNGSSCDFLPETIKLLREAGFSASFTTIPGHYSRHTDKFTIPRLDISTSVVSTDGQHLDPGRFSTLTSPVWVSLMRFKNIP